MGSFIAFFIDLKKSLGAIVQMPCGTRRCSQTPLVSPHAHVTLIRLHYIMGLAGDELPCACLDLRKRCDECFSQHVDPVQTLNHTPVPFE